MSFAFFTGTPGIGELLVILVVVLLLFGAKKLPELSRALGKSLSEFKKGRDEGLRALDEAEVDLKKAVEGKDSAQPKIAAGEEKTVEKADVD